MGEMQAFVWKILQQSVNSNTRIRAAPPALTPQTYFCPAPPPPPPVPAHARSCACPETNTSPVNMVTLANLPHTRD